jgi:hypothetical protein
MAGRGRMKKTEGWFAAGDRSRARTGDTRYCRVSPVPSLPRGRGASSSGGPDGTAVRPFLLRGLPSRSASLAPPAPCTGPVPAGRESRSAPMWERQHTPNAVLRRAVAAVPPGRSRSTEGTIPRTAWVQRGRTTGANEFAATTSRCRPAPTPRPDSRQSGEAPSRLALSRRTGLLKPVADGLIFRESHGTRPCRTCRRRPTSRSHCRDFNRRVPGSATPPLPRPRTTPTTDPRRRPGTHLCRTRRRRPTSRFRCRDFNRRVPGSAPKHSPIPSIPPSPSAEPRSSRQQNREPPVSRTAAPWRSRA